MLENVKVPEYAKQQPKTVTDESAEPSMGVLSFNLNQQFVSGPDKTKIGSEVEIVILAVSPPKNFVNRRAYWVKDIKDGEDGGQPDCSSPDGVAPYPEITNPQSSRCDKCSQSVKNSARTGKGSACHQSKQILFVWPDKSQEGLNRFKAPASSLKSLNDYIYAVNSELGSPIAAVVTGVRFNPDSEWTQPEFYFKKFLPEAVMKLTCQMAVSPAIMRLSGPSAAPQIEDKTVPVEADPTADTGLTASGADETDEFIDSLFDQADVVVDLEAAPVVDLFQELLEKINSATSLDAVKKLHSSNQQYITSLIVERQAAVKNAIKQKAADLKSHADTAAPKTDEPAATPLEDPWSMIKTKAHLPALLAALIKKGPEYLALKLPEFIVKASILNEAKFNVDEYGVSGNGYPALCKDGSFKKKKSSKKKELPDPPDDIMDMLDDI